MNKHPFFSQGSGQSYRICLKGVLAMTTDEVLNTLGRYAQESHEVIVRRQQNWESAGRDRPQQCILAKLAGPLRILDMRTCPTHGIAWHCLSAGQSLRCTL